MMGRKIFFGALIFLLSYSFAQGQSEEQGDKPNIFAVVKDVQGDILEGYLRVQPEEIRVTSKDNQEKIIPSKYIRSITLEKIKDEGLASVDPKQEIKYSVRLENSQEVYTLRNKYTFSVNTNLGVVTKSIDPELINSLLKDSSNTQTLRTDKEKSFIQDKSIVFSLEFKF